MQRVAVLKQGDCLSLLFLFREGTYPKSSSTEKQYGGVSSCDSEVHMPETVKSLEEWSVITFKPV